ncbi:MAG: trehalose-phosphatase [Myxococcales bacterium]|nr:MAG: trehalose-phosphatase [Myxococcales bacterium]
MDYTSPDDLAPLCRAMREARPLVLLFDYDGTLVPHAATPELAQPDPALLALLDRISQRPHTHVHVVSGRDSLVLEDWFGRLPIGLHAEHGATSRRGGDWTYHVATPGDWRPAAMAILQEFTAATPGSLIEEKPLGMAWHYRLAEADHGVAQADQLRHRLTSALALAPVEVRRWRSWSACATPWSASARR